MNNLSVIKAQVLSSAVTFEKTIDGDTTLVVTYLEKTPEKPDPEKPDPDPDPDPDLSEDKKKGCRSSVSGMNALIVLGAVASFGIMSAVILKKKIGNK